ncbi:AIR synthase family protein [Natronobiforma cellulositropha]|uniref:AIR synthase family protein n=1 Tax=Natronobiforma cellulositropha TaxID=1679076 RepID=UPI0021D58E64|nr:AIR synthase family protein [Natronobiforma cellulositropha]
MPGKVRPDDLLTHVFGRTGATDETVLQGPATGEDAAAIDWPGGSLVVSSDPISLAATQVGSLGVHVACNDVAASGADPRWLTVVLLLPSGGPEGTLETVTRDLDSAAREVGATVVGGHSEYVDALERPLVSLTAMGATDRFVPTGGADPGDRVLLTKAAGLEGSAILAADFGDDLALDSALLERASGFFEEISVVPDGRCLREYASAMHDPTEGGLLAGLSELASASGVRLEVDPEAVPVREETRDLCAAAGVDPHRIFGSGALLATVPGDALEDALESCRAIGLEVADIGSVTDGEGVAFGAETVDAPPEDDLYSLWAAADAEE